MAHVKSVTRNFNVKKDSFGNVQIDTSLVGQYKTTNVIADTSIITNVADRVEPETSTWQFSINGGYAYRLFKPRIKSTPYEKEYIDNLKSGYSLGADLFYFPWKKVGFGLKYDRFNSKGKRDIRTKDDITIEFMGASVAHRLMFQNNRTSVLTAFWLGYQPYRNEFMFIGQNYKSYARTMGWGVSVSLDHRITQKLALSFSASCFMGSFYKYEQELKGSTRTIHLARDRFEDLSRAEFTVGLKFVK